MDLLPSEELVAMMLILAIVATFIFLLSLFDLFRKS